MSTNSVAPQSAGSAPAEKKDAPPPAPVDPRQARLDAKLPSDAAMRDARKPLIMGFLVILVAFFGFGTWAATAPLDSAAIAPGFVTVESNRRTIQHLEGGIVDKIFVRDGDHVEAGDVLIRLDDTRARAQLQILRADLDQALGVEARLKAERDGAETVTFPEELTARADDPNVAEIMESQRGIFRAREASMEGQKSILQQRIGQYEQQIAGLQALVTSKREQSRLISEEVTGLRQLLSQGYIPKTRVLALDREAQRLLGEQGEHTAAIARARQGIGEAQMQIYQLEKARQEEIAKELRDVQARITETRERLVAAEDVMRRIDITAPVAGTVLNLAVHTDGGVVQPGEPLMDIVPENDNLVVEVQINPGDIDSVYPGQEVTLRLGTVEARNTPVLYGTLETVSADRITDPNNRTVYYRGKVVIPKGELTKLGDITLVSGMPVEALINRGERTALNYLFKPLMDRLAKSFTES